MASKRKVNLSALSLVLSTVVLFAALGALIFYFARINQERIIQQNQQYLEDAAAQSVKRVDQALDNGIKSIAMVSRLYELQLTSPHFDYHLLNEMSEPTPFSYIRFLDTDGVSWTGEGESAPCADREYFRLGMEGKTGVAYLHVSRFTNDSILTFYAPLYYQGKIIGVVNGVIPAADFTDELATSFFGIPADVCIAARDGAVVASSWNEGSYEYIQGGMFADRGVSDQVMDEVRAALAEGRPYSFRYQGTDGEGNAYLAPLAHGDFILIHTMSSTVTRTITRRANEDALRVGAILLVLFVLYLLAVALYTFLRSRKLRAEKADLSQIVDSVKELYRRFVVFDLADDSYEYLKEDNLNVLDLPPEGKYSDWVEVLHAHHDPNPDFWITPEDMTPQRLQEQLTPKDWYTHRDYAVPNGRWERLTLIRLDAGTGPTTRVLGAVEDITETKRQEEENRRALEAAFHAAEAASQAKSDFLSRMSHDIRTPMNAIIGLTAIMGSHLDDRDRVVECLTKITSSSKHLLALINEVLDMSKIESGRLVLSEAEFSLPALVDDLMDIIQPTVNAKHQQLDVYINGLTHENVIGDGLRLQQVLVNILSNAVKYTGEDGHIVMSLTELPSSQPLIGEYEFIFEDNGIGMSPEFLKKIFNPFERADDERISNIQGTGLGMSIAQSIVQLMGGLITVESVQGEGSKFTVRIALKVQTADAAREEQLCGLPVLVVDDEQVICETTCMILTDLGMLGEWSLTGREAVERVVDRKNRGEDFFAVILDWKMPGMNGVETARAIRREVGPEMPIIILSAYDWSEIEAEARAAGVNAFIGKPLFKSRLQGVFVNLLTHSQPEVADPLSAVKQEDFSGHRALLVEDNLLNQEIAKEILEMTGLEVELAENGKVALETFQAAPEHHFDIVFMDVQMPIMNGYEATRAIRALTRPDAKEVPIVAMTANTFNEDVQDALAAGMDQHLGKPLDMDQLMAVLRKWLGNK